MSSKLELRPLQAETLKKVSNAWQAGHNNVLVQAPCGFGKCHGIDTGILMADGDIKPVQDVEVGDRLLGPDGRARNVLALGRGREMLYRVVPRKGDPYICNESHILSLRKTGADGIVLADGTRIGRGPQLAAVPLRTFIASNKTARTNLKGWRAPAVAFADAPRRSLLVPPYILGAWLGDGRATQPWLSKPDCHMVGEWTAWCRSLGCDVIVDTQGGTRCPNHRATTGRRGGIENPVMAALRAAGVDGNKHIPLAYKTAPVADRLELLAGLLDSDGYAIPRGGYDWISVNRGMAFQLAFVARSLGFACYIRECEKSIRSTQFSGTYWRCSLSGDLERIPCRDKPTMPRRQIKRHLVHGIEVEPIGEGDYYGFAIDGDHLYLLADFTVCHNTELATAMLQAAHANGKRGAFICDRISLIDQTGQRFDKYGLPHGVIQAQHWRRQPYQLVQLCSVQTLRRRTWPDVSLLIADEAHVLPKALRTKLEARECYAIGLTATPFTKGLGKYFDALVNATTTNHLIETGWLTPFRIFAPSQPDMTGVKVRKGEWEEAEAERHVLPVVGDCVAEYLKRGEGRKFIAFAVSVAHAEELQRQFMAAGIVVDLYTYRQNDAERQQSVEEFRKPDSYIRGLISIESLTRGFDVADVGVLILARPLRKSLTVHLQMIGRVLRTAEGKSDAIILDHAGNTMRFWDAQCEYMEVGATELDDGKPKKKQKKHEDRPATKCPKCAHVHKARPHCPACGYEYPKRRSEVHHVAGELRELVGTSTAPGAERQALYSQLVYIAEERGYKIGWAAHKYRERMGSWPNGLSPTPAPPTRAVLNWVRSRQIAYAKGRKAA